MGGRDDPGCGSGGDRVRGDVTKRMLRGDVAAAVHGRRAAPARHNVASHPGSGWTKRGDWPGDAGTSRRCHSCCQARYSLDAHAGGGASSTSRSISAIRPRAGRVTCRERGIGLTRRWRWIPARKNPRNCVARCPCTRPWCRARMTPPRANSQERLGARIEAPADSAPPSLPLSYQAPTSVRSGVTRPRRCGPERDSGSQVVQTDGCLGLCSPRPMRSAVRLARPHLQSPCRAAARPSRGRAALDPSGAGVQAGRVFALDNRQRAAAPSGTSAGRARRRAGALCPRELAARLAGNVAAPTACSRTPPSRPGRLSTTPARTPSFTRAAACPRAGGGEATGRGARATWMPPSRRRGDGRVGLAVPCALTRGTSTDAHASLAPRGAASITCHRGTAGRAFGICGSLASGSSIPRDGS